VLKENMTNKLMILKERSQGKCLVLQEQMMATGELKLMKNKLYIKGTKHNWVY